MSTHLIHKGSGQGFKLFTTLPTTLSAGRSGNPGHPPAYDPGCVGVKLSSNGSIYVSEANTETPNWVQFSNYGWLRAGNASSYDVKFTLSSGNTPNLSGSCTSGTWYNLASDRYIGYTIALGSGSNNGTWVVSVATTADHSTILATDTWYMDATSQDYSP